MILFGVCVLIIRAFVFGVPSVAESFFSSLFRSSAFIKSFTVQGRLYGKSSRTPRVSDTRAILPLPAALIVADAIVAVKLNELTEKVCTPTNGFMFGARKITQVLDVAHAAHLHLQKGGDCSGMG